MSRHTIALTAAGPAQSARSHRTAPQPVTFARAAPKISTLGKTKRGGGGSGAQISAGFTPALSRREQVARAKATELADESAAKERNYGLSSAYDSVFRASSGGDDEESQRASKLSKKEKKRMEDLEASLRR